MPPKVFSGLIKVMGVQRPTIVAATSQKRAAELLDRSVTTLRDYWVTSEDAHEIAVATASPETVFRSSGILKADFKPVVAPIATNSTFYSDGWRDARASRPSSPPSIPVHAQEYLNGYQAAQMAEDE